MIKTYKIVAVLAFVLYGCGKPVINTIQSSSTVNKGDATSKVLIAYDAHGNDIYGKWGLINAILLKSLLGHFNAKVDILPVEVYAEKTVDKYSATFYLGSFFDNPVPEAFMNDVLDTDKKVVWMKYNIWQLSRHEKFSRQFGVHFDSLRGFDSAPSDTNTRPGFFDTVLYKNKSMIKYYQYDQTRHAANADPDIGVLKIDDPSKASAFAQIKNSRTQETVPYILKSQNFWYVADIPFSYISPQDRYLAFCDLLHDMLDVHHAEDHRALVRLEDVNHTVAFAAIKKLSDYLYTEHVPFSLATIPFYRDPLGVYNNGKSLEVHLRQSNNLQRSLTYAIAHGGSIVTHGYTHQYNNVKNPDSGVSGDDFEFWDTRINSPVAEDSEEYALGRVDAANAEFTDLGFSPFAWEPPHYSASAVDYRAFGKRGLVTYQRVTYFTSDKPTALDTSSLQSDISAPLFFPYVINQDYYGQFIIPENLGNITYDIDHNPNNPPPVTWQTLAANAEYALVVRDGFASFFFHPFWVEEDLNLPQAMGDFKSLINGIRSLGYRFVAAPDLVQSAH
ncbi:MAG: DUF2334 domain-containing protein [Bdellovibrionales bacterium]|nr:DUF2334 domain-containing protein [Bdellovibrionales bacterium]